MPEPRPRMERYKPENNPEREQGLIVEGDRVIINSEKLKYIGTDQRVGTVVRIDGNSAWVQMDGDSHPQHMIDLQNLVKVKREELVVYTKEAA